MTETESHGASAGDVDQGIQFALNGLAEPIPPPPTSPAAAVVKGLRSQLRVVSARRRGIRALLAGDVHTKPGEILDAIWTNKTALSVLLAVSGVGVAVLATLHR